MGNPLETRKPAERQPKYSPESRTCVQKGILGWVKLVAYIAGFVLMIIRDLLSLHKIGIKGTFGLNRICKSGPHLSGGYNNEAIHSHAASSL